MTAWIPALPHVGAALLALFVPGCVLLAAAGARWGAAVTFAPLASVGAVGVTAVAADLAGLPFGVPVVAAATAAGSVVLGVLALGLRRLRPGRRGTDDDDADAPGDGGSRWALPAALALASTVLAVRLGNALGGPERVSQTYDAVFHLNTTRYIVESGQGSSLQLAGWSSGSGGYYPAAWHDLAALAAVDGDVIAATQALGLVVGAVVWPLSVLALAVRLVGRRWLPLLGGAAVLAGLGVFPARLLDFGVLYPFLLGVALVPALLAVVHAFCGRRLPGPASLRGLSLLTAGGLGFAGLALAHAGVVIAFLLVAFPLALEWAVRTGRAWWARGRRVSTVLAAVVVPLLLLVAARTVNRSATVASMREVDWPATGTMSQAAGSWLLLSPSQAPVPWVAAALVLGGICVAGSSRGLRWLVAAHVLLAVPYVFAAGLDTFLSQQITAFWYNDPVRVGALVALTAAPLAVVALDRLAAPLQRAADALSAAVPRLLSPPRAAALLVIAATSALGVGASGASSRPHYEALAERYDIPSRPEVGTLLTADERRLLQRLPDLVPAGTRLATNPWDGSGLAYAVSGVEVLVPRLGAPPTGPAGVVVDGLADATRDPQVCRAAEELGVRYALDFGPPLWRGPRAAAYPGLRELETSSAVELVASEGRARLYEVTACGGAA